MNYVIGSGPSGISAAVALVQKGEAVTLIDGGLNLEPEKKESLLDLQNTAPEFWSKKTIDSFKNCFSSDRKGVQLKYIYGSDFPYQDADAHIPKTANTIGHLTPSLASGGFSNVWGAAVLPYTEKDTADWPLSIRDLSPHYRKVLEFMDISGSRDDLEKFFPLFVDRVHTLRPSQQAEAVLNRLARNRNKLEKAGIIFGRPRLALAANKQPLSDSKLLKEKKSDCIYCGLCLYGCPYELIYSSNSTLAALKGAANFSYQPNIVVKRIEENNDDISIIGYSRIDKVPIKLAGSRVFLAAGVLSSMKILLTSMERFDEPANLKVSEYFILPLLSLKGSPLDENGSHGLAQVFLEDIAGDNSVHMQLYTYSELYYRALENMLKPLGFLGKILVKQLSSRMHVIQGYLHSDHSSKIEAWISRSNSDVLNLKGCENFAAKKIIKQVGRKLLRLSPQLGLFPLLPLLNIGLPGEGRHAGSSFPMSSSPGRNETDLLGRPFGFKKLHLVDASVLPSIPASTITLTAMANAHRIASEV